MLKTVRVVFSKQGRARFISHLDLMRTMQRVVRRADLPVWYTEGFNRHPYFTFASPLSLGYEGLHETMDLRLEADLDYGELVSRLNSAMPDGLQAVSAAEAVKKPGDLAVAQYCLTYDIPFKEMEAFLSRESILVEKKTKKKTMKTVDIKPAFANARLVSVPEGCEITVTLPTNSDETVNPALLLTAFNEEHGVAYRCRTVRLELLDSEGRPFR